MLNTLWIAIDSYGDFSTTIDTLKKINIKRLFINGFTISSTSMLALFLGKMLINGGAPHTAFFELIAYFIYSYLFVGIILVGLSIFKPKIYTLQFFALYMILDFPFIAVLPFALLGFAFPAINFGFTIISAILGFTIFTLKIKLFIKYFQISLSQVLVIYSIPFVLVVLLTTTTAISLYNNIIGLF